jgi:signal transduction histidine kinase
MTPLSDNTKDHANRNVDSGSNQWPDPMATFDRLAVYLRHEITNAVSPAVSILDLLKTDLENQRQADNAKDLNFDQYRERLEATHRILANAEMTIDTLIERVTEVSRWMESFYIPGDVVWTRIDIHNKLDQALEWLRVELKDILIIKNYGFLPPVSVFPGPLGQVFLNLFRNAITAMEGHGAITIDTMVVGSVAQIKISDTGKGISPEQLKQIFNPGFTTRRGSAGLGLAICRHIMDTHKGTIQIGCREEGGAVVTLSLPLETTT